MLRLYASDPLYKDWNALCNKYAQLKNAHMFTDLAWFCQQPEPERVAFMAGYEADMREVFEMLTR